MKTQINIKKRSARKLAASFLVGTALTAGAILGGYGVLVNSLFEPEGLPTTLSLIHISSPRDQRGSRMPSSA